MELEQGGLLRLRGSAGVLIGCTRGALWITEQGDPVDYAVDSGQRHRVRSRGLVVAEALRDSSLWLCRPVGVGRSSTVPPPVLATGALP